MSALQTKRSTQRTLAVIICFIAVIGYLGMKYMRYSHLESAASRHYQTVESLMNDVEDLGGQLVVCNDGECRDIKTRELVANGRNGYYIVYPARTDVTQDVLEHQSSEIKRLIDSGQRL
jgi:hypothetical protein